MTLPIDPLAALIALCEADADLVSATAGRIFGGDRPAAVGGHGGAAGESAAGAALTLRLDGGTPRPGLPLADIRVEARCWGGTGPDGPGRAVTIWRALRGAARIESAAAGGAHLLWSHEADGPHLLRDPDSGEAFVRAEFRLGAADASLS